MRAGGRVRVVGLVGVAARAVGERGVEYCRHMPGTDHAGIARAAERLYVGENALAGEKPRTGDDGGKSIDDVIFGARGDFRGQLALERPGDIRALFLHQRRYLRNLAHARSRRESKSIIKANFIEPSY